MNNIFFLQATTGNDNSGMMNIIFLLVIFVIFYFFMVRPQNKKRKELQNMRKLKKGSSIVTIGGIHGKISDVHESTVTVIVDSNTKIKIDKSSVSMDSSTKLTEDNKH